MPKKEETNNYYSLIVCGGGGSRLWPLSRQKKPKQFISLFTKETLLQKTITQMKTTILLQAAVQIRKHAGQITQHVLNKQKQTVNCIKNPHRL